MYKLEYLPIARQDMIDIVLYISNVLNNPTAAEQLAIDLIEAGERILQFPYANPVCTTIKPLKHEYRKLLVQNYIMFYWVNESDKIVTVTRVVYARRDYKLLLEPK